jgi:molybdenum cofactor cytidylyltransferase
MIAMMILAAGRSKRMGSANKLTLPLGDKAVLDYVIDAALKSDVDRVLVVTNDKQVTGQYDAITYLPAPMAHLGQSHSIAAGITYAHKHLQVSGALIALGDMPFLTAQHINAVLQHAKTEPGTIWRPEHDGRPGHPVYWPRRYFSALEGLEGDEGAKPLLKSVDQDAVKPIHFGDDSVLFDVDTPERFDAAKARLVGTL